MNLLGPVYAVAFLYFSIGSIRQGLKDELPRWSVGLEAALTPLALVGFSAYHLDYRSPALVATWQGVAPAMLAGYAYIFVRDLRRFLRRPDVSEDKDVFAVTISVWVALLFVVPALWANVRLGFGGRG